MTSKDGAVHIQRIEGTVMPVNSYVVEGPDGLVVVDGQLTITDARAVRTVIDRFGRPVAGLLITHGHPDHYAGAARCPVLPRRRPDLLGRHCLQRQHAYLVDGHHQAWIATLDHLQFELPENARLYVGHGEPTDTSVLARQADCVRAFVKAVDEHRHATVVDRHDAVVVMMGRLVSDDRLLFLMALSIEPVLATLTEEAV